MERAAAAARWPLHERGCALADGRSFGSPPRPALHISTPVHLSLPRHAAQRARARAATSGQEHLQPSPARGQLIIHHEDGPLGRSTRNPSQINGAYTPLPASQQSPKPPQIRRAGTPARPPQELLRRSPAHPSSGRPERPERAPSAPSSPVRLASLAILSVLRNGKVCRPPSWTQH